MWKKSDETSPQTTSSGGSTPSPAANPAPRSSAAAEPRRAGGTSPAIIGESIRVQGEIHGDEDLLIEGEVDGQVHLDKHSVTVGRSGRVKADIHGGVLVVEGKVQGNLYAHEQAVVRASGEVRGNITSPRVSLEDGAKFKGSIDMEPRGASRAADAPSKSDSKDSSPGQANGSGGASAGTSSGGGSGSSSSTSASSGQGSSSGPGSSGGGSSVSSGGGKGSQSEKPSGATAS